MAAIFTQEFLHTTSALKMSVGPVRARLRQGEHRSIRTGDGVDFRDFQAYCPGDDLRRVDWNIYRRSGELFLRRFDDLQTVPVHILLDVSSSMQFETPSRMLMGAYMAAAITDAALRQHNPVTLYAHDAVPGGGGMLPGLNSKAQLPRALQFLEAKVSAVPSQRPGNLLGGVAWLRQYSRRPGIAVIISDFFDPCGIPALADEMGLLRHRMVLLRIGRTTDEEPVQLVHQGAEIEDCEFERRLLIDNQAEIRAHYLRTFAHFENELETCASRLGAVYRVLMSDRPVITALEHLFPNGRLSV